MTPEELRTPCLPETFAFETTAEVEDSVEVLGQERALEALRFGAEIARPGYNVYALGVAGTGRHAIIRRHLERAAEGRPAGSDWCYVHHFDDPRRPRVLELPAGVGTVFRADMEALIDDLRPAVTAAFESEEYRTRRQVVEEELKQRQEAVFADAENRAREHGLAMLRTPMGIVFAPMREGSILSPDEFHRLPEAERRTIESAIGREQEALQAALHQLPVWERETREKLKALNRDFAHLAVGHRIDEIRQKHAAQPAIVEHLDRVHRDLVENVRHLLVADESSPIGPLPGLTGSAELPLLRRYRVNLVVDRAGASGAPVLYEDHPTLPVLCGRVEHAAHMGTLLTDFNLIQPGVLHRANGGTLIVDAEKLLVQPFAWNALKRTLLSREIRIESPWEMSGMLSTVSLEPEPIPLEVKIVLVGDRRLYYLLCELDPEFSTLFKVAADFDDFVERTPENELALARRIAGVTRSSGLLPFDRAAVAALVEHASRRAESSEKLSTRTRDVVDLLGEADHFARREERSTVGAADVRTAIDARIRRSDRIRERWQEETERGTILIDTAGSRVGQVNGLSVITLGDAAFGRPTRISARVRLGRGEVVDIEREVELGGPIHSKGVLILTGFLGERFARTSALALAASLVFEQSYGGIEGDSASAAELFALLSAISAVPLRQGLAVTGSVNQHGEIQAIGGVNEKIEGFFDLCRVRGLDGTQGVIVPAANVRHLMLRTEIVEAVAAERFHVHAIHTIDEGLELLTGRPAGAADETGRFPEGSVNRAVADALAKMGEAARAQRGPGGPGESTP